MTFVSLHYWQMIFFVSLTDFLFYEAKNMITKILFSIEIKSYMVYNNKKTM